MSEVRIAAEPRTEFGKGGARRTRRAGKVPAVLYGHGSEVRHLALPARDLLHAFKGAGGANVLLSLQLPDGGSELAIPRQIQRDPLRGELTHVDLLLVRQGEKVAVDVPLLLVGEALAVKLGGMLDQQLTTMHVEAEATHIPNSIEVDISSLTEIGKAIHAGDIKLPTGTTSLVDPEAIVVHAIGGAPEVEDQPVAAAEEGAEDAAPAEAAAE